MTLSIRKSGFVAALMLSTSLTLVSLSEPASAMTWASSNYNYCDAKLVAATWGMSIDNAKVQIVQKLQQGGRRNVNAILKSSRAAGNRCDWEDTGYTYSDAQQLASIWGLSEPYQAKLKVAKYFTKGQSRIVKNVLGH